MTIKTTNTTAAATRRYKSNVLEQLHTFLDNPNFSATQKVDYINNDIARIEFEMGKEGGEVAKIPHPVFLCSFYDELKKALKKTQSGSNVYLYATLQEMADVSEAGRNFVDTVQLAHYHKPSQLGLSLKQIAESRFSMRDVAYYSSDAIRATGEVIQKAANYTATMVDKAAERPEELKVNGFKKAIVDRTESTKQLWNKKKPFSKMYAKRDRNKVVDAKA